MKKCLKTLLMLVIGVVWGAQIGIPTCYAEELPQVEVKGLKPILLDHELAEDELSKEGVYWITNLDGATDSSKVTITTDNPSVAGIYYELTTLKKAGCKPDTIDDYSTITGKHTDSLNMVNGNEIKLKPESYYKDDDSDTSEYKTYCANLKKGTWYTAIGIVARASGTANITVSVDNAGNITSRKYSVNVGEGKKPSISKETRGKNFRTVDELEFSLNNLQTYGTVTFSFNKKVKLCVQTKNSKGKRKTVTTCLKGKKTFKVKDLDADSVSIIPQQSGTLKFNVKVEQSGKTYKLKTYTLKVSKYENPFDSLKVGSKNLTKCYEKYPAAGCLETNCYPLSDSTRYYIQGIDKNGKTNDSNYINIKMKKGYTLVEIKSAIWGMNMKKVKNGSKLPVGNNEVYITYKDKTGKKWVSLIWL